MLNGIYRLDVTPETLGQLRALLSQDKFNDLPGDIAGEKERCSVLVDAVLTRVAEGIEQNPRKSWVLEQFLPELEQAGSEDTEARERIAAYLEQLMDILGIASSDGMLGYYL